MRTKAAVTGKQMCEVISRWLSVTQEIELPPEAIWKASPSGELWHVGAMFEQADEWARS